jgi:hypothetical protein
LLWQNSPAVVVQQSPLFGDVGAAPGGILRPATLVVEAVVVSGPTDIGPVHCVPLALEMVQELAEVEVRDWPSTIGSPKTYSTEPLVFLIPAVGVVPWLFSRDQQYGLQDSSIASAFVK